MKKILIMLLLTGAFAACRDNNRNHERINREAIDSTNNLRDTSMMNTDTMGGRTNPNSNQDSLRYNK